MRFAQLLAIPILIGGCNAAITQGPSLELDDLPAEVTFAVGEQRQIGSAIVRFERVVNDSRCPTDVTCVWEGNAELEVAVGPAVGEGPEHLLHLNTTLDPKTGAALGLSLTLLDLKPAPVSTHSTSSYRLTLRIESAVQ